MLWVRNLPNITLKFAYIYWLTQNISKIGLEKETFLDVFDFDEKVGKILKWHLRGLKILHLLICATKKSFLNEFDDLAVVYLGHI